MVDKYENKISLILNFPMRESIFSVLSSLRIILECTMLHFLLLAFLFQEDTHIYSLSNVYSIPCSHYITLGFDTTWSGPGKQGFQNLHENI